MGTIFGRQPALFLAVIHAGLALAIGFGIPITVQQFALLEAFISVVVGFIVFQNVTPTAAPTLKLGTPVTAPGGDKDNPTLVVTGASPNR